MPNCNLYKWRDSAKVLICNILTVCKRSGAPRVDLSRVYYNINLPGCQEKNEKTLKNLSTGYPQEINRIFTGYSIDLPRKILIIHIMKNENKRPSKKVLVAQLLDKGVDKAIVQSLSRANIDTLIWVLNKCS